MKRFFNKRLCSALLAVMICISFFAAICIDCDTALAAGHSNMKLTWFDVGAGDSLFIKLPNGKNMLIDAGTKSNGDIIVSKLKKMKVSTIHYLISTHPDSDHTGGLQAVFKKMNVKYFYYPDDVGYSTATAKTVITLAKKEKGCKLINPKRGRTISGGNGAKLRFVQSNKDYSTSNQDSLALFIDYGNLEVLVCGDNEKGSQIAIEKHNVDILQLPHHGSKYATTSDFIKRFDPERVIVSTDGEKYGHPNVECFKRLKAYDKNILVWRTDKKGDITVTATGKKWSFNSKGVSVSKYCSSSSGGGGGSNSSSGSAVYITAAGSKYHVTQNCRGLSNAKSITKTTLSKAKAQGLTPCKICA